MAFDWNNFPILGAPLSLPMSCYVKNWKTGVGNYRIGPTGPIGLIGPCRRYRPSIGAVYSIGDGPIGMQEVPWKNYEVLCIPLKQTFRKIYN